MKLMSLTRRFVAAILMAGGAVGIANAAPVTVPDFSFEITPITPGGATAAPFVGTNWSASGNGGVFIQDITNTLFTNTVAGNLPPTADGTNYLVENINGHTAYCWQNVGLLESNTIYTLTIALGQSLLASSGSGDIALVNGTTPFGALLASTPANNGTLTAGTFVDTTLVFTNGYKSSGFLTILMQGNSGAQLCFDNVRLDATATPLAPLALVPGYSTPSTNVYQGTVVTLSENPAGAPPFFYQWRTDNGSGGVTFTPVAGATNINVAVDTTGFTPNTPVEYVVVVSNSFGTSTSAPVTLTAITGAPVVLIDTLPANNSSDVVGSSVTFTTTFDGSRPLYYQWQVDNGAGPAPIANATNSTLTLSNLQLTDSGSYSVTASNAIGETSSSSSAFLVNPVPPATNGLIASPANQVGLGGQTEFTPTWTVATGSLIAGKQPSSSVGNFQLENAGGIVPLTDGIFGPLPPEGNAGLGLGTGGIVADNAGSSLIYTLPASTTGYDLTNITVYGGWSDNGRDEQDYEVFYSTVGSPTNFQLLMIVDFLPTINNALQSATRVILTATNGVMAKNVAAVQFYFNYLAHAPENGYEGYAELQVFGTNSAPLPALVQNTRPGSGSDVVGSQITFSANFSSSTPEAFQWMKDGVPIAGATNTSLTLANLQTSDTSISPGYRLQASNSSGTAISSPCPFTVNPTPGLDGAGFIVSPANQTGSGTTFTPTWTIAPGSLITGQLPNSAPTGDFAREGAGGIPILTDGQFGLVGSGNNSTLATCGGGAGQKIVYALNGSQTGYDLSSIVTFGGWSDGGRDQQAYNIYYSTVANPTNFILLDGVSYLPTLPGSVPSTTRITITPGLGGPLVSNVAAVLFDFTTSPTGDGENGYEGYAELQLFGSPSASVTPFAPAVLTDTLPATGSDVVGSAVTFTASFDGTAPITYQWQFNGTNIAAATTTALTLSNLQLSQSGAYNLVAMNAYGTNSSTTNSFTVNPVPAPVNGVIIAPANQLSFGNGFSPTWTVVSGSLIAGQLPTSVGAGNFKNQGSAGGTPVLTDGQYGSVGIGSVANFATCGTGGGGNSVTYTLSGSSSGYNITQFVTYGGWGDAGRDQQAYTIKYSTVANPTNFVSLASVSYLPSDPGGKPSATRVTCTSSGAGPLAANVAAVQFNFTSPSGENGWEGYTELQIFGVKPFSVTSTRASGGNLIITGTGGSPGGGYTVLTATNVSTPLAQWTTNSTGSFDGTGSFSNSIPIVPSVPRSFYRIRIP
ncbi:MAG TPA: immunoglobulin domain-containing protein [Verrucomicrobiae bacterium]|nr:immunoglobulin domain-containing protein [Verrucomicrobiae bacterium]